LIFVQPVSVIDVGARAAAAADVGVFTIAAFTLQVRVAKRIKHIGLFPQIDEAGLANIPG